MALNNFTEQELSLPFSLSYSQFSNIIERVHMRKAKRQATKIERANCTLTARQKIIAWTQLGGIVKYKAISYTTKDGQGVLLVNNKPYIINATFGDFTSLCSKLYGLNDKVKVQLLKP